MNRSYLKNVLCLTLGIGLYLVLNGSSCSERDVQTVSDEAQLLRYINETEEGQELFAVDGFINSNDYRTPVDNAIWRDSLLQHTRSIITVPADSELPGEPVNWGTLGFLSEVWVLVSDRYTVQTTRSFGSMEVKDTTIRELNRWGFFLKLGNDLLPYLGWKLWGFNGAGSDIPPVQVWMMPSNAALFRGDKTVYGGSPRKVLTNVPFLNVSDIRDLNHGEIIICSTLTANTAVDYRTYQLLSAAGADNQFITQSMNGINREIYLDTIFTASPNPRLWNIIFLQSFDDDSLNFRQAWAVPYRVPQ